MIQIYEVISIKKNQLHLNPLKAAQDIFESFEINDDDSESAADCSKNKKSN